MGDGTKRTNDVMDSIFPKYPNCRRNIPITADGDIVVSPGKEEVYNTEDWAEAICRAALGGPGEC